MGKRKYYDNEEYIDRKIRKLEREKHRIRSRNRRRRTDSTDSSESSRYYRRYYEAVGYSDQCDTEEDGVQGSVQEDSRNEEPPSDNNIISLMDSPSKSAPTNLIEPTQPAPVEPRLSVASASAATVPAAAAVEHTVELEPDILCILGDEPAVEEKFGPAIQKDIASRWSDVLVNGLKEDTRKEIVRRYDVPDNLKLTQAPVLNPEIKAACNENIIKRDNILAEKQNLLGTVISSVANTMSTLLTENIGDNDYKSNILKSLSDTGRLLCHLHFSETQTRRNFLLASLNKDVKDNIKDLKRDKLLFGKDLQDNLKSMKAISKTGSELRQSTIKPKPQPRSKQVEASSSKALNWRALPAPAPPHRRAPAKPISTSGGRKPPPPPRRTSDRRAPPRQHGRSSRR